MMVRVGIFVVNSPLNHGLRNNWLLFRACRCNESFSGTFAHAGKYRIHNRRRNCQIADRTFRWSRITFVSDPAAKLIRMKVRVFSSRSIQQLGAQPVFDCGFIMPPDIVELKRKTM